MDATREDILLMARLAGLTLPPALHDDLFHAYDRLQDMLARMPQPERSDEPAHVFRPETFMPPEGEQASHPPSDNEESQR